MKSVVFLILISTIASASAWNDRVWDYVVNQTVMIYAPKANNMISGGSGFYVQAPSKKVFIVTNEHVCAEANEKKMVIKPLNGPEFETTVIKTDKESDLCLLDARGNTEGLLLGTITFCPMHTVTLGHPKLNGLKASYGDTCDRVFLNKVIAGQSGSPILSLHGLRVVGVIEARHSTLPVGFIVTLSDLQAFLGDK